MITMLIAALVMGGIGSLHCVGMCGPLALSLPLQADGLFMKLTGTMLYNLGRIFTYAILGIVIGLLGETFAVFGMQQWLSVLSGATIILYLLWPHTLFFRNGHSNFQQFFAKLRKTLSKQFQRKNFSSVFFIGVLNGLLPCGLVYMAIAAALATGSVLKSSLFMAAFGLGTLPLMWAVAFFGNMVSLKIRTNIKKAQPYILFAMACLLIVRGLGLGVPYLSPGRTLSNEGRHAPVDCHAVR